MPRSASQTLLGPPGGTGDEVIRGAAGGGRKMLHSMSVWPSATGGAPPPARLPPRMAPAHQPLYTASGSEKWLGLLEALCTGTLLLSATGTARRTTCSAAVGSSASYAACNLNSRAILDADAALCSQRPAPPQLRGPARVRARGGVPASAGRTRGWRRNRGLHSGQGSPGEWRTCSGGGVTARSKLGLHHSTTHLSTHLQNGLAAQRGARAHAASQRGRGQVPA